MNAYDEESLQRADEVLARILNGEIYDPYSNTFMYEDAEDESYIKDYCDMDDAEFNRLIWQEIRKMVDEYIDERREDVAILSEN